MLKRCDWLPFASTQQQSYDSLRRVAASSSSFVRSMAGSAKSQMKMLATIRVGKCRYRAMNASISNQVNQKMMLVTADIGKDGSAARAERQFRWGGTAVPLG